MTNDTNGFFDVFVHNRQTGQTERVSISSAGVQGNKPSNHPSVSSDGRFVAFESYASNLVTGDTNGAFDIFVHDRQTGETQRVSVDSGGNQANSTSWFPRISADGRFVAFASDASNLTPNDINGAFDVFVHDRQTGQTTCVSGNYYAGNPGNGHSGAFSGIDKSLAISADGRYVAFASVASNLVPDDTNGVRDVFVRDMETNQTIRVSVDSLNIQSNGHSGGFGTSCVAISSDGGYVAFSSEASNLMAGDTNGLSDVFVHNLTTGETTCVSVNQLGTTGNDGSGNFGDVAVTADGRFVAFASLAMDLIASDGIHAWDVFVRDRLRHKTMKVSQEPAGGSGNNSSRMPAISSDGKFVAFASEATNLVDSDTNGAWDVFLAGPIPQIAVTGVFRPSNGLIYLKKENTTGVADATLVYGIPDDAPLTGDWNGDGVDSIGIYRNGVFYLKNSNETGYADMVFAFGQDGDKVVAGDWNGDGVDTVGIYRDGVFMLRNANSTGPPDMIFALGTPGDTPLAGDWNGDGYDSCGVFRPDNGLIFLKNENTSGYADVAITFGTTGDLPVMGDWDGDGVDTIGVYREGAFLLRNSNVTGFAEMMFWLGTHDDVPISGKWGLP